MALLMLKDIPRFECFLEAAQRFPGLDPSAAEAYLHLLRAGGDAFGACDANLVAHGLSPGRFTVLMLLFDKKRDEPRSLTPAELAELAGVTRATMTGLIDTLEDDGLVVRKPDPSDRRMMSVHLTARGEAALRAVLPSHFKVVAGLMRPLDEHERKTLVRLLDKVAQQASQTRSGLCARHLG